MLIIEFGWPWNGKGKHSTTMLGKKYIRIWFGIVAITWTQLNQKEFHDHVSGGNTEWLGSNQ